MYLELIISIPSKKNVDHLLLQDVCKRTLGEFQAGAAYHVKNHAHLFFENEERVVARLDSLVPIVSFFSAFLNYGYVNDIIMKKKNPAPYIDIEIDLQLHPGLLEDFLNEIPADEDIAVFEQ